MIIQAVRTRRDLQEPQGPPLTSRNIPGQTQKIIDESNLLTPPPGIEMFNEMSGGGVPRNSPFLMHGPEDKD